MASLLLSAVADAARHEDRHREGAADVERHAWLPSGAENDAIGSEDRLGVRDAYSSRVVRADEL